MLNLTIQDPLRQLPPRASTFAPDVDGVYYYITWVSIFFFVLITGILIYSVIRYRRRTKDQPAASQITHHTALEVAWTVIPLILLMVMFAWGWKGSLDMTMAPVDALNYEVVGKQWNWSILHPNRQAPEDEPIMYVPDGRPARVTLSSQDVLHSFFIPAFRVKRDVLPGRYQMVWFTPLKLSPPGVPYDEYDLFCTEYCGQDHSYMTGKVRVVNAADWDAGKWPPPPADPKKRGESIYLSQCIACHTTDGTPRIGPSFKGVWGKTEQLEGGGTVVVDEAYVTESIRDPNAKIVLNPNGPSWRGLMTAFPNMTDDQIAAIIEYLKTLQ